MVSLLVDIFYWPPTALLSPPFPSRFHLSSICCFTMTVFPLLRSVFYNVIVCLYIVNAFDEHFDSDYLTIFYQAPVAVAVAGVFIRRLPVNVPELGQRLSLSPADWVLSLLGQLLCLFLLLLLLLYLLWLFMHVIERTLLTACQCLICDRHSGSRVKYLL